MMHRMLYSMSIIINQKWRRVVFLISGPKPPTSGVSLYFINSNKFTIRNHMFLVRTTIVPNPSGLEHTPGLDAFPKS